MEALAHTGSPAVAHGPATVPGTRRWPASVPVTPSTATATARRPHSHRRPRRRRSRMAWHLLGYTLAALAGALTHHFTSGLF